MTIISGVDVTDYKRDGLELWYKKTEAKYWSRMATATSEHQAVIILAALKNKPEKQ